MNNMFNLVISKTSTEFTLHMYNNNVYFNRNIYRPRSEGDNVIGSVRLSVRVSIRALLFEPFDL